jgi:hypothetical protein
MTTEKTAAGAASVEADDFDAAFAEAVASVGSGEPASGKPAAKEKVADTAAATDAEVDAAEKAAADKATADAAVAEKAAADKATADAAAAEKAAADKATADAAAAAEKAAADKAAAEAGKTPEEIAAAAAASKKAADEAAARKLAEEAAAKVAADAAAKAAADKAAADKAEADRKATEATEIKDPVLSDEHTKALADFEKEWPDVAKAVKVQQAHVVAGLEARFARALTAIVQKIYDDIGPMAQTSANVEANLFRTQVLEAHKDYDAIYPQLPAWIEKQPAYLVDAYKRVYNEGSVQEVSDLVHRYKESNGIGAQTPGTPAAPAKPADQQSAAAKAAAAKKASELAPVAAKRTTPAPQSQDPNDFDGAFAEAAAQYTK